MKVRSYPGRAVLEDPELLLDPDATRGRAMELLYEASWRECGINWTNDSRSNKVVSRERDELECREPYAEVISQLEGVLEGGSPNSGNGGGVSGVSSGVAGSGGVIISGGDGDEGAEDSRGSSSPRECGRSRRSSSTDTTASSTDSSESNQAVVGNGQSGFLIPRPRLIVPVHTYARRRRTGAPQPIRRRQIRQGTTNLAPNRTLYLFLFYTRAHTHIFFSFSLTIRVDPVKPYSLSSCEGRRSFLRRVTLPV